MKLYYNPQDGSVWYAVYDADSFKFAHTTNIPMSEYYLDEIVPYNSSLCLDLYKTQWKFDIQGRRKYFIDAVGDLNVIDNWTEWRPF